MIHFFRRIRQSMLSQNKTGKYIIYALGEILLVVIGILIALQVNNWNEEQKEIERQAKLLHALNAEFAANLEQLNEVLFYDHIVVESATRLTEINANEAAGLAPDSLKRLIQNAGWTWTFDPRNGALRSGITSGDIHLIKNDRLVNLLFMWQDVVADAREDETRSVHHRMNKSQVIEKYVQKLDYRNSVFGAAQPSKFPSDYMGLVSDPDFEDYMATHSVNMLDAIDELEDVHNINQEILELIEGELSQIKGSEMGEE